MELFGPRIGIDLNSGNKSIFSKLFAGLPGTDSYTNAITDIYQDVFGEGIFTGKGIYDLQVFSTILKNQIPENTVLSHDLLEGSYLRCGTATDILILDGYPYKYNSSVQRIHRWIRGDWQIAGWLKRNIKNKTEAIQINPLNNISKFKILDNLRRSLFEISLLISILLIFICSTEYSVKNILILFLLVLGLFMPFFVDIINKKTVDIQKEFNKNYTGIKQDFIIALIDLAFLPYKAYISINAIIKSIYRMKISKKRLLQWTTSEDAEKNSKTDLLSYVKLMYINFILSFIAFYFAFNSLDYANKTLIYAFSIIWLLGPFIAYKISKEIIVNNEEIDENDKKYIKEIAERTWKYFKEYITEDNNFLPPDNYQENRRPEVIDRTSSTNIGLALLSVISAFDLKFISLEETIIYLEKMLTTIRKTFKMEWAFI